ncbi:hypothetical protein [Plantibacter sp. CFBP 8775]|uniref:hypothetical protein n=1 Tax=Plantibacter sp. CFBP 8775 TaxID=2774038 RepID=UPI001782B589|nr:hypothetical protein [Plantibacter sp. CFBP 8775]MBD8104797.1 hypothetical protein [Plantibacter sp. CFBP 8775]
MNMESGNVSVIRVAAKADETAPHVLSMGQTGPVVAPIRPNDPAWTADVEAFAAITSTRGKQQVLHYFASHERARYGDIQDALQFPKGGLPRVLLELEDAGILDCDLPRGKRRGRGPIYSLNRQRLRDLESKWRRYVFGDPSQD